MRKKNDEPEHTDVKVSKLQAPGRVKPFAWAFTGTLGVLVALLLGGIVGQLGTVLLYIGIALFLALGLDPIVSFMEKKVPRGIAILIVVLVVLGLFAGILLAIIPVLVEQISKLIQWAPTAVADVQKSDWFIKLEKDFGQQIGDGINGLLEFVSKPDTWFSTGGFLASVGGGIASGVTGTIIVLILTLYFTASLRQMKSVAARFVPAYSRPKFSELVDDISGAVGRYVVGQVSLASINAVLTLILMLIIKGPFPLLLALIAFIGSCIPMVGTLAAAIINSLICLFAGPLTAIVALVWYLIYMQIEAYVLSPRIMNKAVSVPGALVVIAAVGGAAIGGVLGALVAVPAAASIIIIIQKVVFPAQDKKVVDPDLVEG